MKKFKKISAMIMACAMMMSVAAIGASAATSNLINGDGVVIDGGLLQPLNSAGKTTTLSVGGGSWTYGVNNVNVFSVFENDKVAHRSSCEGLKYVDSGWKAKGVTSIAETPKASSGNKAWYDHA